MNFEKLKDPKVTAAVDALMELAAKYNRGQLIPWEIIDPISGDHNGDGKHIVKKFRLRLRDEREIVTRCIGYGGVRLFTHLEAAGIVPKERMRSISRHANRARKEIATINVAQLSVQQQKGLAMNTQSIKSIRTQAISAARRDAALSKRPEGNPRRKPVASTQS